MNDSCLSRHQASKFNFTETEYCKGVFVIKTEITDFDVEDLHDCICVALPEIGDRNTALLDEVDAKKDKKITHRDKFQMLLISALQHLAPQAFSDSTNRAIDIENARLQAIVDRNRRRAATQLLSDD